MTLEQAILKLYGGFFGLMDHTANQSEQSIARYCYLNRFWLMRAMAGEVVK